MLAFTLSSHGVVIDCEFINIRLLVGGIYKCKVRNLDIQLSNESVSDVIGSHKENKTKQNVQILIIENQVCHYLPSDINLHFPEVYHFDIRNSGLKVVTSEQMKMFPKLKHLYIRNNPIIIIPEQLFIHNPLLEFINLNHNKIKVVGSRVFEPLGKLISLSIEGNVCIDDFALEEDTLKKLITDVYRKCSGSVVANFLRILTIKI